MTRVVLLDDDSAVRDLLRVMLGTSGSFEVVGEAASAAEGVEVVASAQPDLVLLDLHLGREVAWDRLPAMKAASPNSRIVIFSGSGGGAVPPTARPLIDGFIEKTTGGQDLIGRLTDIVAASAGPDSAPGPAPASDPALQRFVRVAGHDLAQPLQVAFGYLELLRDQYGPSLDAEAEAWVGAALRAVDRSRQLVRSMLSYSRLGPITPRPVDLAAVVAEVMLSLGVEADVEGELPTIPGDASQLTLLFEAVLDNAVRHGSGPVSITATESDGTVAIEVADHGPGIPPAVRAEAFEPFVRGDGVSRPGLGLAIAALVVGHHGGRIWQAERPGGGTVISFTLGC